MGSYTSTLNDTNNVLYIKYAANDAGLQVLNDFVQAIETIDWSEDEAPAPTGPSKLAVAVAPAQPAVTAGSFMVGVTTEAVGQGYHYVPAGQSYKSEELSLSLVHQADVIMAQQVATNIIIVYKGSFTVWSGATANSTKNYNMSSQLGGLQKQAFQISGGIVSVVSAATVEQAVAAQAALTGAQKAKEQAEAAETAAEVAAKMAAVAAAAAASR
ncbi:hypothetical protein MVEN_00498500 [Mycena venus]|uniref:Uncharacterized protein n=1 Tax=Mycena venus TaxID=2733690 RepID=A0A8H6YS58_9AGAR|nr:hypothetical protein MVEN_00498500 [Mycena venus]